MMFGLVGFILIGILGFMVFELVGSSKKEFTLTDVKYSSKIRGGFYGK
ncbi:MAG: hypothetical protein Q7S22_08365 [Candidatus Micrarchaeota archaeon]|nr:hypothetical protein [Candidatus Micrarchaeota archaeon]